MEDIKMGTCNMLERRAKNIRRKKLLEWLILCEYMWIYELCEYYVNIRDNKYSGSFIPVVLKLTKWCLWVSVYKYEQKYWIKTISCK